MSERLPTNSPEYQLQIQKQRFDRLVDDIRRDLGPFNKAWGSVLSGVRRARIVAETKRHESEALAGMIDDLLATDTESAWRTWLGEERLKEIQLAAKRNRR